MDDDNIHKIRMFDLRKVAVLFEQSLNKKMNIRMNIYVY